MPCQSEYLEPTAYEKQIMETARLLIYVKRYLGLPIMGMEADAAKAPNSSTTIGDKVVQSLCGLLSGLEPEVLDKLVYNAKDRTSRRLADWWEAHQEADRKRVAAEKKDELLAGQLFGDADLPDHKKQAVLKWYKGLGGTGQSYVNLLLLIRAPK